ncbi:hypothetical protein M406DRAFT_62540 [Cryphonectria parasitica EP155]|uniref:TauD/TfdA-like domain-containing protein n=1 Tax=Cryphonectria parasitica (strain ATCC 38755 / EP155) TaxID=660469 RepID=A0A9P5CMK2_CRYP1|nr:uncharacterized protein M406DRAFT_62540 [Cryphonectria parasitica EP155]KAF3764193.1 hypothetical protein M406DRAFT_62540 [Cryphonectria parasitica EP155]
MATVAAVHPVSASFLTPTAAAPPGQPDIQYAPDYEKYQARGARRLQTEKLPTSVPEGFPDQLTGDMVWEGETLAETYDWTYVLKEDQLAEIDEAVQHFKSLNLPISHVTQETFPLPNLHAELRRLSHELHFGHGFFVLRGVRVDDHTREENVIIYTGLSAHIAAQRGRQDHRSPLDGSPADVVLTHIKDLSYLAGMEGKIGSPAYTTDKQVFHTDSGDIVSLFALETAVEGGASKLASTWRVYNELASKRPDLIHTLTQPWDMEVFEKDAKQKFTPRPLMFHHPATDKTPERVSLQYARRYFVGFGQLPRNPEIPPITEAQAEALDALHFLGDKFCVNTHFAKGDIQYVNNVALFHARDGFVDSNEKRTSRHLLRLWLRDPEYAWKTPEAIQWRWDQIYGGVTPEKEILPLEPFVRSAGKGRSA